MFNNESDVGDYLNLDHKVKHIGLPELDLDGTYLMALNTVILWMQGHKS